MLASLYAIFLQQVLKSRFHSQVHCKEQKTYT